MSLSKKPYKGTRDFFPERKRELEYIFSVMKKTAEAFAYEPYDGPLLEEVDLYRAKSGEELINEQIYSFMDRGEREVAIRPEMTPTVARMVAQVHRETPKPIRWYAIPNLMRYERPQKGRLREHWQFNCDIFGAPEGKGEIEILQVAISLMKNLGATKEHFEILINDRRFVDAFFNEVLKTDQGTTYKLYKVIDKSKKVPVDAIEEMLTKAGVSDEQKKLFNEYLALNNFDKLTSFCSKYKIKKSCEGFLNFINDCKNSGIEEYLSFDTAIVRGLDYYTGIVFEIFDKNPENRRAICGGGAFANLLQIFKEAPLPGIGFGLGDVTLTDFLNTHKLMPDLKNPKIDLLVTFQDDSGESQSVLLAQKLREKGLKVELHFGNIRPKKVFNLTDKKGHSNVTFMGEQEVADNSVQIKNLDKKETKTFKINDIDKIVEFLGGIS
jgi:histidyl-tRNA synthetase